MNEAIRVLAIKDVIDAVSRSEERMRQNWIGYVSLTYGTVLLAGRDDRCFLRVGDQSYDLKEWAVLIYPIFTAYFLYGLVRAFRDRRLWISFGLASKSLASGIPEALRRRWMRAESAIGRAIRDFATIVGIGAVFWSGMRGVIVLCYNPLKPWFANTMASFSEHPIASSLTVMSGVACVPILVYGLYVFERASLRRSRK
jgi:hypothetical protein